MKFDIITLFPEMFAGPMSESILKRAQEKGLIEINCHNLRDFTEDKHKTVDDTPCGGGKGMVIKVDVVDKAINAVESEVADKKSKKVRTILMDPRGKRFNQEKAIELSNYDQLIFVCGHYEGFDERVKDNLVDESISIGDFVLTGGELPTMCIIDAVSRMIPGVITEGSEQSESFMQKNEKGEYLFDYPNYTRPIEYKGLKVPEVLLSGDHKKIAEWRNKHKN